MSEILNQISEIHSPVPFWLISGDIEEWQVARELDMMQEKGISEVIVCPGRGLDLSDAWFETFGWCIREAKKRDMRIWVHSELSLPGVDYRSKRLAVDVIPLSEMDLDAFQSGLAVVAANMESGRITKTRLIETPDALRSLTGPWTVFNCHLEYDEFYMDTLSPVAVEAFREAAFEPYRERFADDFGKTIRAFFMDEPAVQRFSATPDKRNLPYTDDLFESFEQRFGYSPLERIPQLFFRGNGASAFRADFWDHIGYLFNERFHRALSNWCEAHWVIYTGHTHSEEPLRHQITSQGNMFGAMRAMDIPGVDHLGKPTLGNFSISIIGHRIASSQAHFAGKSRVLSESFGMMDWDTTFTNLKRVTDWQYALGVNLLVPHALYHSISGPSKRECPPSFFYQSTHWADFDCFTQYLGRLEEMLVGGKHSCKVAVMYPLSGLWASYQPDRKTAEFEHLDNFLNSLCLELVRNQVDFDLLDFAALQEATLADNRIKLGDHEFEALIIPPTPYARPREVLRLTEVVRSGVHTTMFYRSMEPLPQNAPDMLKGANFVPGDQLTQYVEILRKQLDNNIQISGGGSDDIMAFRRTKDGRKITFLLNRSEKHRKVVAMIKDSPDAAIFDPETGLYTRVEGRRVGTRSQVELRFQPGQGYFVVSDVPDAAIPAVPDNGAVQVPITNLIASVPFNVASVYSFTYTKTGSHPVEMDIRTNPRYIQTNLDVITPVFEQYAGAYEAEIEVNLPPDGIQMVLDADYAACEVYLNDTRVNLNPMGREGILPTDSGYLIDFTDLIADVSALIRQGRNVLRVVSPTRLSEPIRLVGDFRVHVAGRLVVLVPTGEVDPLQLENDYPFYSGTVTYRAMFNLLSASSPLELNLGVVQDSAEVWVNGKFAGKRLWAPYILDIASFAVQGENELEIKVRNNMANLILGVPRPIGLRRMPTMTGYE